VPVHDSRIVSGKSNAPFTSVITSAVRPRRIGAGHAGLRPVVHRGGPADGLFGGLSKLRGHARMAVRYEHADPTERVLADSILKFRCVNQMRLTHVTPTSVQLLDVLELLDPPPGR
jgi:hypothetical protein